MEDLDISQIVSLMNDPKTSGTIESLMEGMDEVQKIMGKFEKLVETMDRMGLKAGLMRMAGAKLGVDVDTPLGGDKTVNTGVEPKTPTHKAIFQNLNSLSEEELNKMFTGETDGEQNINQPTE